MADIVCVVDLGTTLIKAALVDEHGEIAALARIEAPPVSGEHGEFDAELVYRLTCQAIGTALEQWSGEVGAVRGLALSSQRAGLVCVGRDGLPTGPALSWQGVGCQRAAERFYDGFGKRRFRALTGLLPGPIYTVAKLAHLREAEPERFAAASRFVLLHDYVLHRLGADDFYTDPSNGSASGLMDLGNRRWSDELLEGFSLSTDRLPRLVDAGTRVGGLSVAAAGATGIASGTPLVVGGGDQQCAALGAGGTPGTCVISLGTAAAVLCPVESPADAEVGGVLCTAHLIPGQWMVEGFQASFGSSFRWVGDLIGTSSFAELAQLAGAAPAGADGLLYLPFLSGIGSPNFDGTVRGGFLGAALAHGREQLARAVLEGVALELRRVMEEVKRIVEVERLAAVGGGARAGLLPSLLADITGLELQLFGEVEAAVLGAAVAAWVGIGRFDGLAAAARAFCPRPTTTVVPCAKPDQVDALYRRYLQAVATILGAGKGAA